MKKKVGRGDGGIFLARIKIAKMVIILIRLLVANLGLQRGQITNEINESPEGAYRDKARRGLKLKRK